MPTTAITTESLTPHVLAAFERAKSTLAPEIACRLKCSRAVRHHGNHRDLLLFNVWDRHQTGVFAREHFSYCLGYNPMRRFGDSTWYLNLEFNTKRIYQNVREITDTARELFRRQVPEGFTFQPSIDHESSAKHHIMAVVRRDEWTGPLEGFADHFAPLYERLIGTLHPYLMPIFDAFTYDLTPAERAEVIASRQRFYTGPRKRLSAEELRQYTRSIPASWRARLIAAAQGTCPACRRPLPDDPTQIHIDHIKPFSKGGLTVLENLRALCADCNLAKGNRE